MAPYLAERLHAHAGEAGDPLGGAPAPAAAGRQRCLHVATGPDALPSSSIPGNLRHHLPGALHAQQGRHHNLARTFPGGRRG